MQQILKSLDLANSRYIEQNLYRPLQSSLKRGSTVFLIFTLKCVGAAITHSFGGTIAGKYMIKGLDLLQLTKSGRISLTTIWWPRGS